MTIKDIAKLAGVSPSTVSKIVNGKTDNISAETRERVLKVVKEYNYSPYASAVAQQGGKTLLIGVMVHGKSGSHMLLSGILHTAREQGYGTIVCTSNSPEEELKNISLLLSHRVDGVLWEQAFDPGHGSYLDAKDIPYLFIDTHKAPPPLNLALDYRRLGYLGASILTERKHQKIACLAPDHSPAGREFYSGFQECLYEHNIANGPQLGEHWRDYYNDLDELMLTATGFLCYDTGSASELYQRARRKNYAIPRDLSIVALAAEDSSNQFYPPLSLIRLPYQAFGSHCCRRLIAKMEQTGQEIRFAPDYALESSGSIDVPITVRNKKIVVVGALNMDTLVNVSVFPKMGETTTAKSFAVMPGGKGTNQAIGAAKLGAEVCLIGRLGRDFQGNALLDAFREHNINAAGVKTDPRLSTGHAYIYVQENGESSIVIYEGANASLSAQCILEEEDVFQHASFCLLQTEIRGDTVDCAARLARQHGAKVILKPAAISVIPDELVEKVSIFLPNLNEMNQLCPGDIPLEEKAQHFLDKGVETVIVTMAQQGCYLRDREHSRYFPAADFSPVDTTGAADSFAATLAVFLSEGRDIVTAIRYATTAAGFSITRQGVPPALPDRSTLELYLSDSGPEN